MGCAISRHAARTGFVRSTYEKQTVQDCKNIRDSLGWNYKSAAPPALSYGYRVQQLFTFRGSRCVRPATAGLYRPFSALNILADL